MRKLMCFMLGFGAACAYCAYTWSCSGLILPSIVFALLFAAGILGGKWAEQLKVAGVICLGISFGLIWFQGYSSQYLGLASELDGKLADVKVYCTDYSYSTDYGAAVEGFLYLDGKPCRVKFYVNADVEMEPGDVLSGCFKLRFTTEGGEKGSTYHQGKGIFLLGYQREDAQLLKAVDRPFWAWPAVLRHNLTDLINEAFPSNTAGFAKALLLGDRTDIDYQLNTIFKVSGIMHIIAVSGLHVTILFTLINMLCFKRRWLVALFGIPALLLFAAIAGFTPSVVRACIMQCLMIGAMLFDREYDGPTELAFASLIMLLVNPLVITSVSFQLSVGCMIGIFLFQKRIYEWLCAKLGCEKGRHYTKIKRFAVGSISVTLSAISLTTPLSAFYFGAVSLVGIMTNMLTLWAVSFIFYGIILVCLLYVTAPGLAVGCAAGVSVLIRYVLVVAQTLAQFPIAAVYTRSIYIILWLIFCYALLAIFLFGKEKRPGLMAVCMVFGLIMSIGASYLEPKTDGLRVTVLDVGQGQSILLHSDGKTYVIDCGGDYDDNATDITAETLLSQGINRIDGLILTHFDRDHAGGALNLLTRIPADCIYYPDIADESGFRQDVEILYPEKVVAICEDLQISYGDTSISIYPAIVPDSDNDASLAILFRHGNCDILITGDRSGFGERLLLKEAAIPELDILVAGHHGSKNSTCEELLLATNPKIVAISVGENSYGHPAQEVLDRLEQYGCIVYRTDIHGNLIFRR